MVLISIPIRDIIIGITVRILKTCDDDWASLYVFDEDVIAMDIPAIKRDADTQVIIPIKMVKILILIGIVANMVNKLDAIKMLRTVNINPMIDAIRPTINDARYFPIINSLALIGNVSSVSRVPFSFSTAVALVAILVQAKTIDIIM